MTDMQTVQLSLKIDHDYELWFGKYAKQTLGQIALRDYCYFDWLKTKCESIKENPTSLLDKLKLGDSGNGQNPLYRLCQSKNALDTLNGLKVLLNSYKITERCKEIGCQNSATRVSIYGTVQFGYSVSPAYVYCNKHSPSADEPSKIRLVPIKHDSLLYFGRHFYRGVKTDTRQIQEVLNELAGFKGKITKQNAKSFFQGLEARLFEMPSLDSRAQAI